MNKEIAKQEVDKIVKRFQSFSKYELDSMPEEDIKFQFIEPLFEALGWKREDISKETRILKGRADYLMKIENQYKLVVEAKKTSVNLSEEEGKQAVSYAYHKNIKFAVLTNFKKIRIYHALSNIKQIDKNLLKDNKGYLWINCEDFVEQFDRLWLLSRESFEKEEINKLLQNVNKRLIKPIDESILADLLQYREWLSKDLKNKREYLSKEQIDEIVQILIDRLIFMRSVEDRGLEAKDFLLKIVNDVQKGFSDLNLWAILKDQFERFDKTYNSKLFVEGLLEKEGFFDTNTITKVIKGLYFGTQDNQERYRFDDLPVDLLGSIYEQYLGVVLRGTEKRVKLDLVSGKRKKMGIYYTPSYIVDYIVKNTLGEYVKNKSLDEILDIKILDPACGSGSFLINAFQELISIVEERLKNGEKSNNWDTFKNYKGRLTLGQKATLLLNCIYGVDLDEKAVELAQLNLLLKILEEETRETKRRILPNMKDNIKNGNSLISDSRYDKAFNWNAQNKFKDIMREGGFNIVIGNPPYVKIQTFIDKDKKENAYLEKNYVSATRNFDLYVLFVERGLKLLKENGKLGYILPHKFFQSGFGIGLREYVQDNKALEKIIDFKDNQVFEGATTYTCLLFLSKDVNDNVDYIEIESNSDLEKEISKLTKGELNDKILKIKVNVNDLNSSKWIFLDPKDSVLNTIKNNSDTTLKDFTKAMFQGVATGKDKIFFLKKISEEGSLVKVYSKELEKEVKIEKEILRPLIKGNMLKQYSEPMTSEVVLFPYKKEENKMRLMKEEELKKYLNAYKYLKIFEKDLRKREGNKFNNKEWYCFSRNQGLGYINEMKILTPDICKRGESTIDKNGTFLTTTTVYGVLPKDKDDFNYLLAILNSNLLRYFIMKTGSILRGGFYRYKTAYLNPFPVKIIDDNNRKKFDVLIERIIQFYKEGKSEQEIKNVEYEINEGIYKLYGLSKGEIKIIENKS